MRLLQDFLINLSSFINWKNLIKTNYRVKQHFWELYFRKIRLNNKIKWVESKLILRIKTMKKLIKKKYKREIHEYIKKI